MMHIKVKVTTTPLGVMSTCMSCSHCATGCQCGDILIKAVQHAVHGVVSLFTSYSYPVPSPLYFLCHSVFYLPPLLT